jgi:hypothetical protein
MPGQFLDDVIIVEDLHQIVTMIIVQRFIVEGLPVFVNVAMICALKEWKLKYLWQLRDDTLKKIVARNICIYVE